MGQFWGSPSRPRNERTTIFRFQKSHLMRCTERLPDFWYFVYVPVRTFRYPLTACKVKPHHPFAVESETGTHRALMHAFPSYRCPNFISSFLCRSRIFNALDYLINTCSLVDLYINFLQQEKYLTRRQVCIVALTKNIGRNGTISTFFIVARLKWQENSSNPYKQD